MWLGPVEGIRDITNGGRDREPDTYYPAHQRTADIRGQHVTSILSDVSYSGKFTASHYP